MFERGTETGREFLLKWIIHCEYTIKRASKRLYILRQLHKAGYSTNDLIEVYCCLFSQTCFGGRSSRLGLTSIISECWYWSFKNNLRSGYYCYNNFLEKVNLFPLHQRREKICHEFIKKNKNVSPIKAILNRPKDINNHDYNLRSGTIKYSTKIK